MSLYAETEQRLVNLLDGRSTGHVETQLSANPQVSASAMVPADADLKQAVQVVQLVGKPS